MLHFFKKQIFASTHSKSFEEKLEQYQIAFFNSPYHSWIIENKNIKRAFNILLDSLNKTFLDNLSEKNLICLRSFGILACTLTLPKNSNVLIIYPDLIKLLHSASPIHAIAIMAHELGHIIHNHSHMEINPIIAQIEADRVAFELGFGAELLDQLKSFPTTDEYQLRIRFLESLVRGN